ncbi:11570_t:CDS:2, partial [Funneliformis mosseae]
WDHVSNFMKKYAATKGHRVRIGSGGKVNKAKEHIGYKLHPLAVRFIPTLRKLPEEVIEEICFLTVIAKANATIQYRVIREKFNIRII